MVGGEWLVDGDRRLEGGEGQRGQEGGGGRRRLVGERRAGQQWELEWRRGGWGEWQEEGEWGGEG